MLSEAQRERVQACDDVEALQTWIEGAVAATTMDDVLG